MRRLVSFLLPVLALVACEGQGNPELLSRVEALEAKVKELEAKPASAPADGGPSDRDRQAYETFQKLQAAMQKSDFEEAKKIADQMEKDFADIPPAMQAIAEIRKELSLIGADAPGFDAQKWFTGKPTTLTEGKATLVVFWEVWCPHCRREVPRLQEVHDKFASKGLNIVGLTQVSNGKTDDEVAEFLKENKVTYPNAKVDEKPSEAFVVGGIPAAAIVKNGKIVWRGHPGGLTDEVLQGWLEG